MKQDSFVWNFDWQEVNICRDPEEDQEAAEEAAVLAEALVAEAVDLAEDMADTIITDRIIMEVGSLDRVVITAADALVVWWGFS